ncbi:MAG: septal ring lytic transglycosylase RlpA family protein [Phormidesmis sp.]
MFVLFNGSNKSKFASSLAAALLLSGAGITLTGASSIDSVEAKKEEAPIADAASNAKPTQLIDALAANGSENTSTTQSLSAEQNEDILVLPHAIDGRQAATLYVKDIPVLTFLGTEVDRLSNANDGVALAASDAAISLGTQPAPAGDILSADAQSDPVLRATALGEQLEREANEGEAISVRWTEETEGFTVTLGEEDLIALDSRTILADTTHDSATDAIQVTNRLRRLLGGAEPISEIEGMPEPEPEPVVEAAPVQKLAIASTTVGGASWYGPGFNGRLSASGEVFNQYALTAAHRTLPFGTRVLVTNLYTGQQVTVRINDRGPYAGDRIIDLSAGAAEQIGLVSSGVGTVQLDVLY